MQGGGSSTLLPPYSDYEELENNTISQIRALSSFLALMLAAQTSTQTTVVSDFVSPCPNVFSYDPLATETNRWYGTINLTTDTPLYALWLNIVLENRANILGNWLGEVTTNDNIDFKIENTNMMITPDKPLSVHFFVQYKDTLAPPKLKAIRFNGKEICRVKHQVVESGVPVRVAVGYEELTPEMTTSTTARPTVTTTLSAPDWYQSEQPQITATMTTLKPQYWMETQTTERTSRTQQPQYWQRTTPNLKPSQTPNWFYPQADNNQQVTSTVKQTNQIRTGNTLRITTENNSVPGQVQSWPYSQTTDRNRTATPVWLNVAPDQNVSSKATRPNNFQIEVKQVGNTKYWSKIPENTTGAAAMALSGPESLSYERSRNEQRVPDSELQNQPYANISINQAESTQNQNQPRDRTINVTPQNSYQPWVQPARNEMAIQSRVDTSRYPTNDGRIKSIDESRLSFNRFQTSSEVPVPVPIKIEEDNSKQAEYYKGGIPVFYIPNLGPQNIAEPTCGKVFLNKGIDQNVQSTRTLEGQWPWLTALYQQQNSVELHYKYVCGSTLVSKRHLITAAHCVARQSSARPVNMDTLLVFLGKHNLRTSVEGIDLKFVYKILIYPDYDPTIYRTDLAILTLREPVTFTNKIQPICLWPEQETDLQNVVGETGSTVGWGYEITGVPREDQTLLQMEVIDQQTCHITYGDFFSTIDSNKTFCAAYRNSGMTCNGDSGGGMVFQKGGSWYLRGVVSLSVARQGTYHCDANNHVIFTDVAKFLPWIQDNIEDNPTCGKVFLNKGIDQNVQSTRTLEGQWPWLTALYQQQNSVELHYKYVCGSTLVSKRHLITAAHCVARQSSARPVNMDTLLVFLGKHNLRTSVEGIDLKFVYKILIYPDYDPTIYRTDLAILTLREPVTFTNKIQPICLWPEQETDLKNVVGETGSTVGWGYEITGVPREDQTLLQMEVIDQQTCHITYGDFFSTIDSNKTFCAAYRNSGMTCNGDSGGGMVFQKGGSWYLRGVVSLSVARQGTYHCDTNNHVIFTDVAKFLPWIQDNIEDNI